MQRDRLICCLVGRFTALEPSITGDNLRIKVDQDLQKCNFLPLETQEDLELIQELLDETVFASISSGKNRKTRRSN